MNRINAIALGRAEDAISPLGFRALLLRVGITVLCLAPALSAQTGNLTAEYTKRAVMLPMRDGVKLYTQILEPLDRSQSYPILLFRTPYSIGNYGPRITRSHLGPSQYFTEAGYIFIYQDVRGQFRSEGDWQTLLPPRRSKADPCAVDETTDAFDTIEWLLENVEGHNGRAGMWGISYPAWETVMAMADAHPALVAVSPQASPADMFLGDDMHHHGAFRLSYVFAWLTFMSTSRGDLNPASLDFDMSSNGYEFFLGLGTLSDIEQRYFKGKVPAWTEIMAHGSYDEYWQRRNALALLDDVRPAVLNVAGWFDAEDFRGPIDIYHKVERSDEDDRNTLVVGPWQHGGWSPLSATNGESLGHIDFAAPTSEFFQEEVELAFFEHHLRDDSDPLLPEVWAFETGGNTWEEFERWPPEGVRPCPLYLRAKGKASLEPPGEDEGHSEFISDPASPVPFSAQGGIQPGHEYMVEDQRFLAGRPDVLTFATDALTDDLVIAGRVEVRLHFSTTGTDADWIVQLIDAYPEDTEETSAKTGESMSGFRLPLTADVFRAKFRDSLENPSPLEPGQTTELRFSLPDRYHRFRKGHRILVQIHSTWFPLYDRNPQTYTDIYHAGEEEFQKATHRVQHAKAVASRLVLPVLQN